MVTYILLKSLYGFQFYYMFKLILQSAKEMIHENEGSFVRVYDVGTQEESASALSEHKGILATIGIAIVLIVLWLLYERKNRRTE